MNLAQKKKELLKMKTDLEEIQKDVQLKKWKQEQEADKVQKILEEIKNLGYDPKELSKEFFVKLEEKLNSEKAAIEAELIQLKKDIQENT